VCKAHLDLGLVVLTEFGNVFGNLDRRRSYSYLCSRPVLPCMHVKLCFYVIGMLGNGGGMATVRESEDLCDKFNVTSAQSF